jgi:hypothetical protein
MLPCLILDRRMVNFSWPVSPLSLLLSVVQVQEYIKLWFLHSSKLVRFQAREGSKNGMRFVHLFYPFYPRVVLPICCNFNVILLSIKIYYDVTFLSNGLRVIITFILIRILLSLSYNFRLCHFIVIKSDVVKSCIIFLCVASVS